MSEVPGGLTVGITRSPTGVTVAVAGELDFSTAPIFADRTRGILDEREHGELTVDIGDLSFCDSAGITAFVGLRHECDERGWLMRLVKAQPPVRRMLVDYTGLGDYLKVQ